MRRPRSFIGPSGMAGMVGLWGQSSLIKSIQRGIITDAAVGSGTATITSVVMENSVLRFLGYNNNNGAGAPASSSTRLAFTNSTTITATRSGAAGATAITAFEVVEYLPGVIKSIQRGSFTIASAASATSAITEVNTNKTELHFLGAQCGDNLDTYYVYLSLTNSTTITGTRVNATATGSVVGFQAVEFF